MPDVYLTESVRDRLRDLPRSVRRDARAELDDAGENPEDTLLPVLGYDAYSLRVGEYRAIVDWSEAENRLDVVDFDHAQTVYE